MQTTDGPTRVRSESPAPANLQAEPRGRLAGLLDTTDPDVFETLLPLKLAGVTKVRVCSPERAAELASEVWKDLEVTTKGRVDRNDPTTWGNENWLQTTHGLMQNQQVGLMKGTCEARLETEALWKKLFGGERCISSFDAISIARPKNQERTYKNELKNQKDNNESELLSSWLHTDQAKSKTNCLEHIQMAIALNRIGKAEQRTQFVIPKSGETMQSFRDRFIQAFPPGDDKKSKTAEREEWVAHTKEERKWLLENGRVFAPTLEPGEAILWDSGVPHASIVGPLQEGQAERNVRISVFVSALPIKLIDDEDLKVRREMLENGDTSGHRVTAPGIKVAYRQCKFSKVGQTYGKELPEFSTERVVTGIKAAFESGEDSIAAKIAKFCGGYGYDRNPVSKDSGKDDRSPQKRKLDEDGDLTATKVKYLRILWDNTPNPGYFRCNDFTTPDFDEELAKTKVNGYIDLFCGKFIKTDFSKFVEGDDSIFMYYKKLWGEKKVNEIFGWSK